MEQNQYQINGAAYCLLPLTLEQDELLAPIVDELLTECPQALGKSTEDMMNISDGAKNTRASLVSLSINFLRINTWLYKKQYVRKMLAILLVPEGEEFEATKIPERETLLAKHASREIARDVINYFFMNTGVFGNVTPRPSAAEMAKSKQ